MSHFRIEQWIAYIQGHAIDRASMDTHLEKCDECLEMYMASMDELQEQLPHLIDTAKLTDGVLEQIRILEQPDIKRVVNRPWYMNTIFHYTIAASITLVMVSTGLFNQILDQVSQLSYDTEHVEQVSVSDQLTNKAGKWLDSIPNPAKKKEGKP